MSGIKIGDLIKQARISNGYKTKKEFSDATSVSPSTLSRIENNTQEPTPETLMKISKHLKNVTYGELMRAARYFDGLESEHEKFLVNLLNENEELDHKIFEMLDTCFLFTSIYSDLRKRIIDLFIEPDTSDLYENVDSNEIKNLYTQNDFDIESKKAISHELNKLITTLPPKLKVYFKKSKDIKPIPLIDSIFPEDGLIPNEKVKEYINFPFLHTEQPHYALRVTDDSMINACIQNGDVVFLQKASWAEYNGQIVAVIVNGEEGSLRRLHWSEDSAKFILTPANDLYPSMEVRPNEIIICGLYAGHYRPIS